MTTEQKQEIKRRIQARYHWRSEDVIEEKQDGITPTQFYAGIANKMNAKSKELERMDEGSPVLRSDGTRYVTIAAAAKAMNCGGKRTCKADIQSAINTGSRLLGYHWCYEGGTIRPLRRAGRKMDQIDVETLKVIRTFGSIKSGADSVGANRGAISEAVRGRFASHGYYWRYTGDLLWKPAKQRQGKAA